LGLFCAGQFDDVENRVVAADVAQCYIAASGGAVAASG